MRLFYAVLAGLFLSIGMSCTNSQPTNTTTETTPDTVAAPNVSLKQLWATDTVFKIPESVLHDAVREVIYVSNVNQNPRKKDGNGFISKISESGEILELEWVSGLSSPKGMGLFGGKLYVTDVDEVVVIDVETKEIIEKIPFEGAKMLNDIDIDAEGVVYLTDMDMSRIHTIKEGKVEMWKEDSLLVNPNGILLYGDQVLIAQNGAGELVAFNKINQEKEVLGTGIGRGDGIVPTNRPGAFLVSDWSGEIWFCEKGKEPKSLLRTKDQKINTADIGYMAKKQILLVPTFFNNRVVAYQVEMYK